MSYSTWAAAVKLAPKMAAVPAAQLDTAAMVALADIEVDAHLRDRFGGSLPFVTVPPAVELAARYLIVGHAIELRYAEDDPNRSQNPYLKRGYNLLGMIRSGRIRLTDAVEAAAHSEVESTTPDDQPGAFNLGTEEDWVAPVVDDDGDRVY